MENTETSNPIEETPQLLITEDMRSHIYETAKWANILAIVGFVISGVAIIAAFTMGSAMNTNPELATAIGSLGKLGSVVLTLIFLCYSFAIFYPSLLMFKYSTKAKLGVLYGDQASLAEALGKMKSLFKYWGILALIMAGFYLLMILLPVVIGVAAS